jgi:hypothetical protein
MHSDRDLPTFGGEDWLAQLMTHALERGACVRMNCTTCGAMPFKKALWAGAEAAAPMLPADEIARQLSCQPHDTDEGGLRFVIYELYRHVGGEELAHMSGLFVSTKAGEQYQLMVEHDRSVALKRQRYAEMNDAAAVAVRRTAAKTERAERHAERIATKLALDAARRP